MSEDKNKENIEQIYKRISENEATAHNHRRECDKELLELGRRVETCEVYMEGRGSLEQKKPKVDGEGASMKKESEEMTKLIDERVTKLLSEVESKTRDIGEDVKLMRVEQSSTKEAIANQTLILSNKIDGANAVWQAQLTGTTNTLQAVAENAVRIADNTFKTQIGDRRIVLTIAIAFVLGLFGLSDHFSKKMEGQEARVTEKVEKIEKDVSDMKLVLARIDAKLNTPTKP